jgi:hypothetical protein
MIIMDILPPNFTASISGLQPTQSRIETLFQERYWLALAKPPHA